ncbi:MAG: ABC transporter substrate binding protein, partial [Spirochaetota bacterium]
MNAKTYLHTFLLILFLPVGIIHAKEEKEIPIVLSSNHSIYMKALSGLTYSLKSKTKVYFLNTKSSSAGIFAELQKAEPEMIVTIGNQATKSVRENLPNATIVFLIVNNPRSLRMEKGRICGFSADISSGEFFKVLKKIKPEARSVSAFYSDEHGKYFSTEGKYHDIWNGLHLQIQQISDKEEMTKKLEKFTKKTESFYMVYDRLYTRETFQDLSNFCKKNQIILMTYYPSLAKIGATFALAPNYTNIGVRAGRWLNKEETDNICQQNKVFAPESSFLYLNQTYAQESGIQFSQEILKREQKERLLAYGIELYHKKKYSSAQAVFRKVLKMDPEEDTAIVFLNEIRDLRTSHEIQKLVYQAEKSRSKRNYHEAIAIYRKIIYLNTDIKDFQEKL